MSRLHVTVEDLRDLVAIHLEKASADLEKFFQRRPHGNDARDAQQWLLERATDARTGRIGLGHGHLTAELAVPAVYGAVAMSSRFFDLVRVVSRDGEDVPLFRAPRWCSTWLADRIAARLERLLFDLDLVDARPACAVPSLLAQELISRLEAATAEQERNP